MYFVTTDQMRDSTASYKREIYMFIWEYIIQNSVPVIHICCRGNK